MNTAILFEFSSPIQPESVIKSNIVSCIRLRSLLYTTLWLHSANIFIAEIGGGPQPHKLRILQRETEQMLDVVEFENTRLQDEE